MISACAGALILIYHRETSIYQVEKSLIASHRFLVKPAIKFIMQLICFLLKVFITVSIHYLCSSSSFFRICVQV